MTGREWTGLDLYLAERFLFLPAIQKSVHSDFELGFLSFHTPIRREKAFSALLADAEFSVLCPARPASPRCFWCWTAVSWCCLLSPILSRWKLQVTSNWTVNICTGNFSSEYLLQWKMSKFLVSSIGHLTPFKCCPHNSDCVTSGLRGWTRWWGCLYTSGSYGRTARAQWTRPNGGSRRRPRQWTGSVLLAPRRGCALVDGGQSRQGVGRLEHDWRRMDVRDDRQWLTPGHALVHRRVRQLQWRVWFWRNYGSFCCCSRWWGYEVLESYFVLKSGKENRNLWTRFNSDKQLHNKLQTFHPWMNPE